jgi:hypothetical protein
MESACQQYANAIRGILQFRLNHNSDLDTQVRTTLLCHCTLTGIYPSLAERNPEMVARVRHHVQIYKQLIRPFLSRCTVYHHTPVLSGHEPCGWGVLEYVAEDRSRAVVGVFRLAGEGQAEYLLRLRGIDPGRQYRLTYDNTGMSALFDGAILMHNGIAIRLERPISSELLLLEAQ